MDSDTVLDRQLYSGLLRLHVLYHAAQEPVFGFSMIEELARHGYRLSPGVMYPLLRSMERKGYLAGSHERSGSSARRLYRATPLGRKALGAAMVKVHELFAELFEHTTAGRRVRRAHDKVKSTSHARVRSRARGSTRQTR